ncbi:hypothetical protein P3T37_003686 [Kitasatospora sp. MAA4]|uniref:hypothetical protein n=1 Tax=Kitasatospora sp. MAA4 TaxID=3035093 RepID=UPI002476D03C|nr:hypothetical protein [Kitasatospora sp. MAA4]MDH6134284.1 hypothetical protein [Kitasatospora sp. MAA4]
MNPQRTRPARRRTLGALALALVGLGSAACAPHPTTAEASAHLKPPALAAIAHVTSGNAAVATLPLSSYQESGDALTRDSQAWRALALACMSRHGVNDLPADFDPTVTNTSKASVGPFGFIDPEFGGSHGFASMSQMNYPASMPKLSPQAQQLWTTTCAQEADADYAKSVPANNAGLVASLDDQATAVTGADSPVLAATRQWADCMKNKGFAQQSPDTVYKQKWPQDPDAAEIAIAEADASCTESSKLADTWFAVLAGYQRQLVDANATQLSDIASHLKNHNSAVDAILTGNGGSGGHTGS